tara:strand:- start:183 stop:314 length:132 start_codon:yes stop_codon:yes gene_type:complete
MAVFPAGESITIQDIQEAFDYFKKYLESLSSTKSLDTYNDTSS